MAGHIATSKRTDWCSPERVLAVVRKTFDEIDLDPCSNAESIVGARVSWSLPEQDGLALPWGTVRAYVNSPFGRTLSKWVRKARREHEENGAEVCLLLPASVDTRHWHRDVWPAASAVGFFRGRLKFLGAATGAPMACALVYYGPSPWRFETAFHGEGKLIRLR